MALFRCSSGSGGGGGNLPVSPNTVYTNPNMASNATASLSVTQKPKFIIIALAAYSSAGTYGTFIYNVEENAAYRYGYFNGAFQNGVFANISNYITSVTDSAVDIKNSWGSAVRMIVGAYY